MKREKRREKEKKRYGEKRHVIGIEGGGTKTIGIITDLNETVLHRITAGPSNYQVVGLAQARKVVLATVRELLSSQSARPRHLKGIGLALAGAGRPADRRRLAPLLSALRRWAPVRLETDIVSALLAGGGKLLGLAAIAGTGSCFLGIDRQGRRLKLGGWGHLLGDEGSGYAIGRAGLQAAIRGSEGRSPVTAVTKQALTHYRLRTLRDLVPLVYSPGNGKNLIASFAPAVLSLATTDRVARQIVAEAAAEWTHSIIQLARRLKLNHRPFPVVLAGGLFHHPRWRRQVISALKKHLPRAAIHCLPDGGALGAVRLAAGRAKR